MAGEGTIAPPVYFQRVAPGQDVWRLAVAAHIHRPTHSRGTWLQFLST